jgi:hypothetical protein
MNRKNRREIASSGIASHLDRMFVVGGPETRSHLLKMVGNLLSSGFFHDKIARDETITNILDNMLDPKQPPQFTAVAYCIAQLAQLETSAQVLVRCEAVRIVLNLMPRAPKDSIGFILTLLVNIAQRNEFVGKITAEQDVLLPALYKESLSGDQKALTALLVHNLSLLPELSTGISAELSAVFVKTIKALYNSDPNGSLRVLALSTLVNFGLHCRVSRVFILGTANKEEGGEDLIEVRDIRTHANTCTHIHNDVSCRHSVSGQCTHKLSI